MSDLEDLLREELKRTAQEVQPEVLRPLRVPASGHGWRPRLLPLAVAAAVIVIIAVVALITGLPASFTWEQWPGPSSITRGCRASQLTSCSTSRTS